jgi:hypothetical protein
MRYFQTSVPASVLYAGGDAPVRWVSGDGLTGVYNTGDEQILRYLDKLIKSRADGDPQGPPFQEITKEAFEAELGKWNGRRFEREREYLGASGIVPARAPGEIVVAARAAVADTTTPSVAAPVVPVTPPAEPPAPNVRRRGK